MSPTELFKTPEVQAFTFTAQQFVGAVDGFLANEQKEGEVAAFLKPLPQLLASLYALATTLPDAPVYDDDPEMDGVRLPDFELVLQARLGPAALYVETFDPYDYADNESVTGSLAEDITTIYRDLKTGLAYADIGSPAALRHALWEWRFGFRAQWGNNLASALRVIHHLLNHHRELLDEPLN